MLQKDDLTRDYYQGEVSNGPDSDDRTIDTVHALNIKVIKKLQMY